MKVKIQNGVYQDKRGVLFLVELGAYNDVLCAEVIGLDHDGKEASVLCPLFTENLDKLTILISKSKYLGKL